MTSVFYFVNSPQLKLAQLIHETGIRQDRFQLQTKHKFPKIY